MNKTTSYFFPFGKKTWSAGEVHAWWDEGFTEERGWYLDIICVAPVSLLSPPPPPPALPPASKQEATYVHRYCCPDLTGGRMMWWSERTHLRSHSQPSQKCYITSHACNGRAYGEEPILKIAAWWSHTKKWFTERHTRTSPLPLSCSLMLPFFSKMAVLRHNRAANALQGPGWTRLKTGMLSCILRVAWMDTTSKSAFLQHALDSGGRPY